MSIKRRVKKKIKDSLGILKYKIERYRYGDQLMLPDFLGLGVQKSGSTWLHENLLKHDGLYLPEKKEIEFFDANFFNQNLQWYSDKFQSADKRKKGEISPSYCYLPINRIKFVKFLNPDIRLILILRNPIERAWSNAFHQLVKRPMKNLEDIDESEFYTLFKKKGFQRQGNYPEMLKNWLSVFPQEQLFIGLFEDVSNNPQQLLSQIFSHIGVTSMVDWNDYPFGKIIVPPVGKEYSNCDPGRGVIKDNHKRSDTYMPEKIRDFLKENYYPDIQMLHNKYHLAVTHWLDAS